MSNKSLAQQFDEIREEYRPENINDEEEVQRQFEAMYDALIPIMEDYRAGLEEDSPLAVYLNYFLRDNLTIAMDEAEEPVLYATIPALNPGEEPIRTMNGVQENIPSYTAVRIVSCSPLGDVGITRKMDASRKFETRVFWDSLTRYRTTL